VPNRKRANAKFSTKDSKIKGLEEDSVSSASDSLSTAIRMSHPVGAVVGLVLKRRIPPAAHMGVLLDRLDDRRPVLAAEQLVARDDSIGAICPSRAVDVGFDCDEGTS
jgi:hypothetical protein